MCSSQEFVRQPKQTKLQHMGFTKVVWFSFRQYCSKLLLNLLSLKLISGQMSAAGLLTLLQTLLLVEMWWEGKSQTRTELIGDQRDEWSIGTERQRDGCAGSVSTTMFSSKTLVKFWLFAKTTVLLGVTDLTHSDSYQSLNRNANSRPFPVDAKQSLIKMRLTSPSNHSCSPGNPKNTVWIPELGQGRHWLDGRCSTAYKYSSASIEPPQISKKSNKPPPETFELIISRWSLCCLALRTRHFHKKLWLWI